MFFSGYNARLVLKDVTNMNSIMLHSQLMMRRCVLLQVGGGCKRRNVL